MCSSKMILNVFKPIHHHLSFNSMFLFLSGNSDGLGVQRRENIQNGSAATEDAGCVLHHHCGSDEKGKVPPGV